MRYVAAHPWISNPCCCYCCICAWHSISYVRTLCRGDALKQQTIGTCVNVSVRGKHAGDSKVTLSLREVEMFRKNSMRSAKTNERLELRYEVCRLTHKHAWKCMIRTCVVTLCSELPTALFAAEACLGWVYKRNLRKALNVLLHRTRKIHTSVAP